MTILPENGWFPWWLVVVLVIGCDVSAKPEPGESAALQSSTWTKQEKPAGVCLVGDNVSVTTSDVQELRANLQPPPPWAEAVELAIDMTLLYEPPAGPTAAAPSMKERRQHYAKLARETKLELADEEQVLKRLATRRDEASAAAHARRLPCAQPTAYN